MKQVKFYGLGGQGAVTASKMLSAAVSLYEDQYAITVPAYGHERRGAPVHADIIIDDAPVKMNCFVYTPDIVVVMDSAIPDKNVDIAEGCSEDTILILNTDSEEIKEKYKSEYVFKKIFYVDATGIAIECTKREIPNASILGALAKTGIVSVEALEKSIMDTFGEKNGVTNSKAARLAYERTKES